MFRLDGRKALVTGASRGLDAPAAALLGGGELIWYAGTTRAADDEIGLPQSMQKRDIASFSRPQKAQETRGVTARV